MSEAEINTLLAPIVQTGHPVLRMPTADIDRNQMDQIRELVPVMVETMRHAPGVGLAAPQIGLSLRLAVIEDREDYISGMPPEETARTEREVLPLDVLINPRYQPAGEERVEHFEGCLSVEGFRALVPRYRNVRVTWTDLHGKPQERVFAGWQARIVQHEIDHLDGILYIDRMRSRSFMSTENWKRYWMGMDDENEICRALGIAPMDSR